MIRAARACIASYTGGTGEHEPHSLPFLPTGEHEPLKLLPMRSEPRPVQSLPNIEPPAVGAAFNGASPHIACRMPAYRAYKARSAAEGTFTGKVLKNSFYGVGKFGKLFLWSPKMRFSLFLVCKNSFFGVRQFAGFSFFMVAESAFFRFFLCAKTV